jgi:hypothetical protein
MFVELQRTRVLIEGNSQFVLNLKSDTWTVGGSFRVCQYSSFHTYVGCHVTKSKVQAGAVTPGNKEADAQPKAAFERLAEPQLLELFAHIKKTTRFYNWKNFTDRWAIICPKQYRDLGIIIHPRFSELDLPRRHLGRLFAARPHHGDF